MIALPRFFFPLPSYARFLFPLIKAGQALANAESGVGLDLAFMEGSSTYSLLLTGLITLAELLQPRLLLLLQIGIFLDFRLVQTVDYGVLTLDDENLLDLFSMMRVNTIETIEKNDEEATSDLSWIFERDLAYGHAAIFLKI